MADKVTISLTILLTGFVVVFSILLLLIGVIKLYGTIVYNIQNKKKKDTKKSAEVAVQATAPIVETSPVTNDVTDDGELIAVIAAAVDSIYGKGKTRIKSIRKNTTKTNVWRNVGVLDNTRPF